jgi:PAS domain S-box-containing protein
MRVVKPHGAVRTEAGRSEPTARDLEQVLEQSGEAVIVKDLNAVVTYWNGEAASLYGFAAQEAIGQPLRKLHAAELSEAACASSTPARSRGPPDLASRLRQSYDDLSHGMPIQQAA